MTGGRYLLAVSLLLMTSAAFAQSAPAPQIEEVIVTAPRLSAEIKSFVQSYIKPSLSGTPVLTRWKKAICPAVFGFSRQQDNDFVTSRVRQIAQKVGAPIAAPPCTANIHIYFAAKPQELLDRIRENGGSRLLSSTPSQAKRVAVFDHAIQAWYATETRDEHNGSLTFDDNDDNGWSGCICDIGPPPSGPGVRVMDFDPVRAGVRSELMHVYVIADINQTQGQPFTAVADYIAMLSLSEIRVSQSCQPLPSITNLVFPDCGDGLRPVEMTDMDLAYLKGVYSVDPGEALRTQQDDIAAGIEKALEANQP